MAEETYLYRWSWSFLAGLCGSHRRMGFFGTFLLSVFLTPVLVLLLLILTGPSRTERDRYPQSN